MSGSSSSSSSSSGSGSLHSGSSSWFGTGFLRRSDLIDADGFLIETFDVIGLREIVEGGEASRRGGRDTRRSTSAYASGRCPATAAASSTR